MKHRWLVIGIIALGLILRLWMFGTIPYGVNRDEASLGYNAFSILNTGRDEHGVLIPWQLESFGDWKKPLYVYLSIIPIKIAGLSEQTTRVTSLIFSILLIIYAVKIAAYLTKNKPLLKAATLFTALLFTLNPWHFFFSRIASETMVATSLFVMAVYYLLVRKELRAGLLLTLTLFTYHAFLLTVPLFLMTYLFLNRKSLIVNRVLINFGLVAASLVLLSYATFFGPESVKGRTLMIYHLPIPVQQDIMAQRTNPWSIIIHNKYVYIGNLFIKNYARSFSANFLLGSQTLNPSYQIGWGGYFFPIEIILAIIGLAVGYFQLNKKYSFLLIGWLLAAPIPAALTFEAVHATREFLLAPAVLLFGSLGAAWLIGISRQKTVTLTMISLFIVASSVPYMKYYFTHYQAESDDTYHGYMRAISQDIEINRLAGTYTNINITFLHESPYIFYAFYNRLDPKVFLQTIEWYPPDFEGFVHVHRVNGILFEERDEEAIALKEIKKQNNLNYSRPDSLEYWIKPLKVWDNLVKVTEIVSWEENQI